MTENMIMGHVYVKEQPKHTEPPKKVAVATGCPLCDVIWISKEAYEYIMDWPEKIAIVMEDEKPWLYIPCEDVYYSDTKLQINFCPKCGRRLTEEKGCLR